MLIGVLGGTGPAGQGIAARLAASGHAVILGSRERARAATVVAELRDRWGERVAGLTPGANDEAAAAEAVVLATVWNAAVSTAAAHADALAGKVLVSIANGLVRAGKEFRAVIPDAGSLAAAVQKAAPTARVVAAFQHVPAAELGDLDHALDGDVLVAGDDDDARDTVLALVGSIPDLRAFDAGSLANALGIEAFAAAMLTVNLRHRGRATLHLSGVQPRGEAP